MDQNFEINRAIDLSESIPVKHPADEMKMRDSDLFKGTKGEIEIIIKDKNGNIVSQQVVNNQVKIFAKEMLSHRIPSSKIWDKDANTGSGGWVNSDIDPDEEFSARYILFGAAFDANGAPVLNDTRYYTSDPVSGAPVAIRLSPGAEFDGGLINAVPIAEPNRPLKRVEAITFQPTYQPACTPLTQIEAGKNDVRAINNIVILETTLELDEYNGFGASDSDYFTITEVALAGGKEIDTSLGTCECDPRSLFLEGEDDGSPIDGTISATGGDIITLSGTNVSKIKQGDQIKLVGKHNTAGGTDSINQTNPFYLVLTKSVGGSEIQLDRVPTDSDGNAITGDVGVYRDTLRIFSHRVLAAPFIKSQDLQITIRWRLLMS